MNDTAGGLRSDFRLASALFFLSGALGLGYQLVWIRKAALVVGSSQIALATVVTSFFIGLGLGSLFVGRYLRSRKRSPLFIYGIFEAAIGLFAFCFPFLFGLVQSLYGAVYPFFEDSVTGLFFVRFALLFILFIIPTFFMGGTLPLLLDGLVKRNESIGSTTSFLYGFNILGAVAGVLLTAYVAIPQFGMTNTSLLAGCGNLALGVIALIGFRSSAPAHVPTETATLSRPSRLLTTLAFLSGFAAIGYQMAWARYFSLFSSSTVYLTAVLLAVYLLALSCGSMLIAPLLSRRVPPLRILSVAQALIPLCVISSFQGWRLIDRTFQTDGPAESWEVVAHWQFLSEPIDSIFVLPVLQIGLVIFVPVLLMGMGLPLLISSSTANSQDLRANSGSLIFWNTLGSSAGGFVGGYILIPYLGMEGAFIGLGLTSLVLSVAAEREIRAHEIERHTNGRPIPIGFILSACALLGLYTFADGDFTRRTIRLYGWGAAVPNDELIDIIEGPLTTAWIFTGPNDTTVGSGAVLLGRLERNRPSSQAVQGHLPALFYPRDGAPQRALGICLGTGQSFGSLLTHDIAEVDVVDISPEMTELSLKHFGAYNHELGSDKRVRFHLDDGRHFVNRAPAAHYDVVSMEPPPPTDAGVYSLYSLEFYREVDRILRDGGVMMQWLPIYLLTPMDTAGIIRTQAEVFPHTFVIRAGMLDFMVVSFKGKNPPRFSTKWMKDRIEIFRAEHHIAGEKWTPSAKHEIASLEGVLALITTTPDDLHKLDDAMIYSDDDQLLSYSSGDREFYRFYGTMLRGRLSFPAIPVTPFETIQKYFDEPIPVASLEEERARSLSVFNVPSPRRLAKLEQNYENATEPRDKQRYAVQLASLYSNELYYEEAFVWLERAILVHRATPPANLITKVRIVVRTYLAFRADEMQDFVTGLPGDVQHSQLTHAVRSELVDYFERQAERDAGYLLSK